MVKNRFLRKVMKGWLLLLCVGSFSAHTALNPDLEITIAKKEEVDASASMRLYVGVFGAGTQSVDGTSFLKHLTDYLGFENRFEPCVHMLAGAPATKEEVTALFAQGWDAALYIDYKTADQPIEWRLYDTQPGSMVCGRRYANQGCTKETAAAIAVKIMKELTGDELPFLTKIAYVERDRKNRHSLLSLVDFSCDETISPISTVLFSSARILVAPLWRKVKDKTFIYLSEFTRNSVHFMCVDETGKRFSMFDQGGTNVGLTFSKTEVVYGHSGTIWRYCFDETKKVGISVCVIKEQAVCASPSLMDNGDIVYCSGGKIKRFDRATGASVILIGSYAVAPAYSGVVDRIVYSGRVNKTMQLFIYDMKTGKSHQVTNDAGDKVDPVWSPCGNYAAFCWQKGSVSRIALINLKTKRYWFVTPKGRSCAYPAWSPFLDALA